MPGRRRGLFRGQPPVVRSPGNTQSPAHPLNRELRVLRLNKAVEILYRCSLAKNAETFFRKSFSLSTSRSRASNALYFAGSTGSSGLPPPSDWPSLCSRPFQGGHGNPKLRRHRSRRTPRGNHQRHGISLELIGIGWSSRHEHNPFKLCLTSVVHLIARWPTCWTIRSFQTCRCGARFSCVTCLRILGKSLTCTKPTGCRPVRSPL
jgi:hypothetical protein